MLILYYYSYYRLLLSTIDEMLKEFFGRKETPGRIDQLLLTQRICCSAGDIRTITDKVNELLARLSGSPLLPPLTALRSDGSFCPDSAIPTPEFDRRIGTILQGSRRLANLRCAGQSRSTGPDGRLGRFRMSAKFGKN